MTWEEPVATSMSMRLSLLMSAVVTRCGEEEVGRESVVELEKVPALLPVV